MGLDMLDMYFCLERRFKVSLGIQDMGLDCTVAAVAAAVANKLPQVEDDVCPTAQTFYQFRMNLIARTSLPRSAVRPRSRLDKLLPHSRERRVVWAQLRRHDRTIPALESSPAGQIAERNRDALLLFIWFIVFLAGLAWTPWWAFELSLLLVILLLVIFARLKPLWRTAFPKTLATVGDLIRAVQPLQIPSRSATRRLIVEQQVLRGVRECIAEATGLPFDTIRPESRLIKDLGMG